VLPHYLQEVDMKELIYTLGAAVLAFAVTASFAGFVKTLIA
jgi:hypothetical protein